MSIFIHPRFETISQPVCVILGKIFVSLLEHFCLIIGTFLSHYQDNLPDKRNREFANVPSVMPLNAALTKLRGVEAGQL